MPSSSIVRRRTNWLGTITALALRADPSCVRARNSRSAREKSCGLVEVLQVVHASPTLGTSSGGSAIVSG